MSETPRDYLVRVYRYDADGTQFRGESSWVVRAYSAADAKTQAEVGAEGNSMKVRVMSIGPTEPIGKAGGE